MKRAFIRAKIADVLSAADEHDCQQGETIRYDKMADAVIAVFEEVMHAAGIRLEDGPEGR